MEREILISIDSEPSALEILNWTQASVRFKLSIRIEGSLRGLHRIFTDLVQTKNLIHKTFVSKGYFEVQWIFDGENEHYLMGKIPGQDEALTLAQIEVLNQGTMRSLKVWLEDHSEDMNPDNNEGFEGLGSLFA
jgi:hypothetical protein